MGRFTCETLLDSVVEESLSLLNEPGQEDLQRQRAPFQLLIKYIIASRMAA